MVIEGLGEVFEVLILGIFFALWAKIEIFLQFAEPLNST
jgi:hypothetical protein